MANLYYTNDQGNVIIEGGVVYERVGQTLGQVNDQTPDTADVQPYTFSTADAQGMTAYSAVQYAVSKHLNFHSLSDFDTDGWIADVDGILRCWPSETGDRGHGIKINGASVVAPIGSNEASSSPVNISAGDKITFYRTYGFPQWGITIYFQVLPFVYPIV